MFWRLLCAVSMASAIAMAQGGMGGEMGGGGGGRPGGGGGGMERGEGGMGGGGVRPQRQTPFDVFAEKLKLSKDQKTEAMTIFQDAAKEIAPIREQMQQVRQNLAGALIQNQTGDPVDQILKAYAQQASQAAGIEAKAFARICKMLKPNQEKGAAQAFELLADTLPRMSDGGRNGNRGER
ncbi:MAG TPA: hypothetical protein VKB88_32610 [Bryobacteraceae bacterium]|nr:hypothetical protein [Bryobacteraceae bacterium]